MDEIVPRFVSAAGQSEGLNVGARTVTVLSRDPSNLPGQVLTPRLGELAPLKTQDETFVGLAQGAVPVVSPDRISEPVCEDGPGSACHVRRSGPLPWLQVERCRVRLRAVPKNSTTFPLRKQDTSNRAAFCYSAVGTPIDSRSSPLPCGQVILRLGHPSRCLGAIEVGTPCPPCQIPWRHGLMRETTSTRRESWPQGIWPRSDLRQKRSHTTRRRSGPNHRSEIMKGRRWVPKVWP